MSMLTIRNVPEEVHRALRARAARHGRSAEAEVRAILEAAVKPEGRIQLGTLLVGIGRDARLTDDEVDVFNARSKAPPTPVDLG